MAGLLGGVVVDEDLQAEAEKAGLKMLLDARKLTEEQAFNQNKDKLNRHYALVQTPGTRLLAATSPSPIA